MSLLLLAAALGISFIAMLAPVAGLAAAPETSGLSFLAGLAVSVVANLIGGGASMGAMFLTAVAVIGLAAGIYDAYILPLLPAIYFFLAVIGILILFVEGFIAAPLWVFSHIRLDG